MSALPTKQKPSVVIVYTGGGKGKTSAGLGLICRALGHGDKAAFVQFIKSWKVSEDHFFASIKPIYDQQLTIYKGGLGFYNAGDMSARGVSEDQHMSVARQTYEHVLNMVKSGEYSVVVCDEINNAVHDGLLTIEDMKRLIATRHKTTSLCMTGRNFPVELADSVDILTSMQLMKHHFNDGFIANEGIDY